MTPREWDLEGQAELANKTVEELKQVAPFMFPQYSDMLYAKQALEVAEENYRKAKERWEDL